MLGIGFADVLAYQSIGYAGSAGGRGGNGGGGMIGGGGTTRTGTLRGLAELAVYPAVHKFQLHFNGLLEAIKTASGLTRIYELGHDGQYGDNTNYGMWLYAELRQSDGCLTGLPVTIRNVGPNVARECLKRDGFTDAEVDQLQRAFNEYKAAKAAGDTTVADDAEGSAPVRQEAPQDEEKSSVWPWVLGGAAVLALGLLIWKSKKR